MSTLTSKTYNNNMAAMEHPKYVQQINEILAQTPLGNERRLLHIFTLFGIPVNRTEIKAGDSVIIWDSASNEASAILGAKITAHNDYVTVQRLQGDEQNFPRPITRFGGLRRGVGYLSYVKWEGVREESAISSFVYNKIVSPIRRWVQKN